MQTVMPMRILPVVALIAFASTIHAGELVDTSPKMPKEIVLPKPGDVGFLTVQPTQVTLRGIEDSSQLVLTGNLPDGRQQDLSNNVKYEVADPAIAGINSAGRVIPLADGATEILVRYGERSTKVPLVVTDTGHSLPINFGNQIVPIFTKLGCNAGGCHGKSGGQNGFRLSLLGFEPELDYRTLVKEARGRRVFPAAPDHSLLLLKAVGELPHGGGKKMEKDSDEYRLIRRWISSGLPYGEQSDPVVTKITVYPERRVLSRNNKQQIAAYAHYSDGWVEDITRRAQYESNEEDIADVDPSGLVLTHNRSGESAIMVRYLGHVAVFRATVPLGETTPGYEFPHQTFVDKHAHDKYQLLGLIPSNVCTDEEFIRRASLDICGTLPTAAEVQKFVADTHPKKRSKLVEELLDRPEYAYYFAGKWADILKVKRRNQAPRASGTFAFHDWIRQAMADDKPYDRFVRDIIAASGDEYTHPPTVWYKELTQYEEFVDDTAQVFLGLRLACAQCHHHPYEKWSQDDYWGLAAFWGRVGRKQINEPGGTLNQPNQVLRVYTKASGSVKNKRTNQRAEIKALDEQPIDPDPGVDPRQKLVDWMADTSNPFFARAVVNRYWAHFFTRGIVEPLDDMRITNPASNEELLDALAKDFVDNKYSLKHLVRNIVNSRTYQLSAVPNDYNKQDTQNFARYYPKRMSAEVLLDAVGQVTGTPTSFGAPQDQLGIHRAIMLPDESFSSYFLDVFGRPQRTSACECERVNEANLAQALHLLNSNEIQAKLSRAGARADTLAKDAQRDDRAKLEEIFLAAFARKPKQSEFDAALAHLGKMQADKKAAYENILWAVINTKEFVFVD